jgi:pimeloyl-ACP methyl ester carboxylesterase
VRFVILHSGWQTAAAWRPVVDVLREAGYQADVPVLPTAAGTTWQQQADAVCEHIFGLPGGAGIRDIVLVAHGLGGPVAQLVAPVVSARLATVVLANAWVLADADVPELVVDLWPAELHELRAAALAEQTDLVPMRQALWRRMFAADVDDDIDAGAGATPPVPASLLRDGADWQPWWECLSTEERAWHVRCLFFGDDQAMPDLIRWSMAQRSRAVICHTIGGSHQVFQRAPVDVAHGLIMLSEGM